MAEPASVAPDGAAQLPCLPIDVFTVFDGEYVQPSGTSPAVKNAIRPDPVGPDLILLKVVQLLAVETCSAR